MTLLAKAADSVRAGAQFHATLTFAFDHDVVRYEFSNWRSNSFTAATFPARRNDLKHGHYASRGASVFNTNVTNESTTTSNMAAMNERRVAPRNFPFFEAQDGTRMCLWKTISCLCILATDIVQRKGKRPIQLGTIHVATTVGWTEAMWKQSVLLKNTTPQPSLGIELTSSWL